MGQQPVVTIDDITRVAFESRRPGCEKGVMHEDGPVQTAPDSPFRNVSAVYAASGKLDTAGNATGTLRIPRFSFDYERTHYDCAAASYAWQARAGA